MKNIFLDLYPTYIPFLVQCTKSTGDAVNPTVESLVVYSEGGADATFDSGTITGSPFSPAQVNSQTGLWGVLVAKSAITAGNFYIAVWSMTVNGVATAKVERYFACNAASFKATGFAVAGDAMTLTSAYDSAKTTLKTTDIVLGTDKKILVSTDAQDVSGTFKVDAKVVEDKTAYSLAADQAVNAAKIGGTTQTGRDLGASVLISPGTGTGQIDVTSGVIKSNLVQILGTTLTETSGYLAAAFKKFFNIGTPTGTVNSIPDAVAGASGGIAIVGSVMGKSPATLASTDVTGNLPVQVKEQDNIDFGALQKVSLNAATPNVTVSNKTGFSIAGTKTTLDSLNDITAVSVWSVGSRTLTSFGTLVADIAETVWGATTRTLTGIFDSSGITTLLSRIGAVLNITDGKVDVNDKAGFTLTSDYDKAKTAAQPGDKMDIIDGDGGASVDFPSKEEIANAVDVSLAASLGTKVELLQNILTGAVAKGTVQRRVVLRDTKEIGTIRGDAWVIPFNLGGKESWEGRDVYFIAKASQMASNDTAIVNRQITVTDAANRVGFIRLTHEENGVTGKYYSEIETRDPEAEDGDPRTDYQGILGIYQDTRQ